MSANNWTYCPKCTAKYAEDIRTIEGKVAAAYGKVDAGVYEQLQAAVPGKPEESLREDYEIGIHRGKFSLWYGASCEVCGFEFDFKHEADAYP